MILEPGQFIVSEHRKAIPTWVKIYAAIKALPVEFSSSWVTFDWVKGLCFDHRPPLQDRPYDTDAKDFVPPQNHPNFIEAIPKALHDQRTFGRRPEAEKTVTTRDSDIGEAKRIKKIADSVAIHQAKLASKRGDYEQAACILGTVKRKSRLKPKRKIKSRGFPKRKARV